MRSPFFVGGKSTQASQPNVAATVQYKDIGFTIDVPKGHTAFLIATADLRGFAGCNSRCDIYSDGLQVMGAFIYTQDGLIRGGTCQGRVGPGRHFVQLMMTANPAGGSVESGSLSYVIGQSGGVAS